MHSHPHHDLISLKTPLKPTTNKASIPENTPATILHEMTNPPVTFRSFCFCKTLTNSSLHYYILLMPSHIQKPFTNQPKLFQGRLARRKTQKSLKGGK